MNESIKFSIMAPVYNVEPYLEDCLKSVLNQTYNNYELILVDDGSTDNCGAICDSYAKEYSNFKVYHKPNGGVMSARRTALKYATGDYYIFLDSDDKLKPFALEKIAEHLNKNNVDCIFYAFDRVLDDKILYKSKPESNAPIIVDDKRELYKKVFFDSEYNMLWRKAVKASVFNGWDYSEFFHIDFGEDLLQSLEIYSNCKSALFVNDDLYSYVVNPESITQKANLKYVLEFTVQEKVWDFLISENVFNDIDFVEFNSMNMGKFVSSIVKVGKSDLTYKKCLSTLRSMRNSKYYNNYLSKGKCNFEGSFKRKLAYHLFKRNLLALLSAIFFISNRCNK